MTRTYIISTRQVHNLVIVDPKAHCVLPFVCVPFWLEQRQLTQRVIWAAAWTWFPTVPSPPSGRRGRGLSCSSLTPSPKPSSRKYSTWGQPWTSISASQVSVGAEWSTRTMWFALFGFGEWVRRKPPLGTRSGIVPPLSYERWRPNPERQNERQQIRSRLDFSMACLNQLKLLSSPTEN